MKECSVARCDEPQRARGWCGKHYKRWRKYGDPAYERPAKKVCSLPRCDEPVKARDWCAKHYLRWRRYGDPEALRLVVIRTSRLDAFWSYVDKRGPDECWPWTRGSTGRGYGQIYWTEGKVEYVHRVAYMLAYGEIPAGDPADPIEIDHLCHDHRVCNLTITCPHRLCCNPAHLEAKPRSANSGRTTFVRKSRPCSPGCTCGRHRKAKAGLGQVPAMQT
jgi:hypothetical protein